MTLTDAESQGRLLTALEGKRVELHSGGSAANTMFGIVISGGSVFYNGKVARDVNGEFYREDLLKYGIHFDVHPSADGAGPTGTCVILTTPDAQRTMLTNLGVSTQLEPRDIHPEKLAQSRFLYMEGYLFDADGPRAACLEACETAKKEGVKISLTFSDPFCVERFKADFFNLAREYCDVIFCNAEEARHFSGLDELHDAAAYIGKLSDLVFVTNGEHGAIVVQNGQLSEVPGFPVKPLDTTGAGDAFAAGVLYGLCRDYEPTAAARWGNYLASRTVEIAGGRLEEFHKEKAKEILEGASK